MAQREPSDPFRAARQWRRGVFAPLWLRSRDPRVRSAFPGDRGADIIARFAAWRAALDDQAAARAAAFERFVASVAEQAASRRGHTAA